MINSNGTSSKPGDWAGGGISGGGVYSEPGQFSTYDSKGTQLENAAGQIVGSSNGSQWGSGLYGGNGVTPGFSSVGGLLGNMFNKSSGTTGPSSTTAYPRVVDQTPWYVSKPPASGITSLLPGIGSPINWTPGVSSYHPYVAMPGGYGVTATAPYWTRAPQQVQGAPQSNNQVRTYPSTNPGNLFNRNIGHRWSGNPPKSFPGNPDSKWSR